jgi:hypothetical protein
MRATRLEKESRGCETGTTEGKEREKRGLEIRYNWSLGRKVRGTVGRGAGFDARGEAVKRLRKSRRLTCRPLTLARAPFLLVILLP